MFLADLHKHSILILEICTELRVSQFFCKLGGLAWETIATDELHGAKQTGITNTIGKVTVQIPQTFSQLLSLIAQSFHKLYIGGIFAIFQKLTDTLGGFLPGHDLLRWSKTSGLAFGKVNTLVIKPCSNVCSVQTETITSTVDFFQSLGDFLSGFTLGILQSNHHSVIVRVTAKNKEVVNLLLRNRKSRGLSALCFVYKTDLLGFGKEQVQT